MAEEDLTPWRAEGTRRVTKTLALRQARPGAARQGLRAPRPGFLRGGLLSGYQALRSFRRPRSAARAASSTSSSPSCRWCAFGSNSLRHLGPSGPRPARARTRFYGGAPPTDSGRQTVRALQKSGAGGGNRTHNLRITNITRNPGEKAKTLDAQGPGGAPQEVEVQNSPSEKT